MTSDYCWEKGNSASRGHKIAFHTRDLNNKNYDNKLINNNNTLSPHITFVTTALQIFLWEMENLQFIPPTGAFKLRGVFPLSVTVLVFIFPRGGSTEALVLSIVDETRLESID